MVSLPCPSSKSQRPARTPSIITTEGRWTWTWTVEWGLDCLDQGILQVPNMEHRWNIGDLYMINIYKNDKGWWGFQYLPVRCVEQARYTMLPSTWPHPTSPLAPPPTALPSVETRSDPFDLVSPPAAAKTHCGMWLRSDVTSYHHDDIYIYI